MTPIEWMTLIGGGVLLLWNFAEKAWPTKLKKFNKARPFLEAGWSAVEGIAPALGWSGAKKAEEAFGRAKELATKAGVAIKERDFGMALELFRQKSDEAKINKTNAESVKRLESLAKRFEAITEKANTPLPENFTIVEPGTIAEGTGPVPPEVPDS